MSLLQSGAASVEIGFAPSRPGCYNLRCMEHNHIVAEARSFSIILEPQDGGGFTVLVPALPEVVTEGDTEDEAVANVQEAIRVVLAYRREYGISIPSDMAPEIRRVTVAA